MVRTSTLGALALLAAGAVAPCSFAQEQPEPSVPVAEQDSETITVIGRRGEGMTLDEYALEFVLEIADPPSSSNGYARWGRSICVAVENVQTDPAQFVADRIGDVARDLGVRVGGPGCSPNIWISFSTDARSLARLLVDESPRLFRPYGGEGGTTQGLAALEAFAESDAPIRWWQVMMEVDMRGLPAIELPNSLNGPPAVAGGNSHIVKLTEDEIWSTFVIVDAVKVAGLSWPQLADYLAMVTLAQIDPEGRSSGYDTILNLFESPTSVRGLTDWDLNYLAALYDLDRRLMPRNQRGALAGLIARQQERLDEE